MEMLNFLFHVALDALWIVIIANVLFSWLVNFEVLNLRQPQVRRIYEGLERIVSPIMAPVRRIIPPVGGLDFSPLVVLVGLSLLRTLVPGRGFL